MYQIMDNFIKLKHYPRLYSSKASIAEN